MDSEQAKIILSAWRPGRDMPEEDPLFEQALAVMEKDPALAEWFAAQNATDDAMRDALSAIEPPAHLRESILAAAKVTAFPVAQPRRFQPLWLAAAAGLVLAAGVFFLTPSRDNRLSVARLNAEIPRLSAAHDHAFGTATGDFDIVRAWLTANGGTADFVVPEGLRLQNRGGVACEVASINGTKVSILCFQLADGGTAHLYVFDRSQLSNPPTDGTPEMSLQGGYAVASWSRGGRSYFLAERGGMEALQRLL